MANLAKQNPQRRRRMTAPVADKPVMDSVGQTPVSPQEFYRELTEREDIQRILTRLAQVKDGQL